MITNKVDMKPIHGIATLITYKPPLLYLEFGHERPHFLGQFLGAYFLNGSRKGYLRWTPKFGQVAKRESRS